jgi:hypothetical protein
MESERYYHLGGRQTNTVRSFPGYARSSFLLEWSKTKDAGMVNVVAGNVLANDKLVFYEGLNQGR